MEDLRCPDPERMHYRELRDRVGYFKNDKEGRIEMSGEFERILNREIEKAVKETRESSPKEGDEIGHRRGLEEGRKDMAKSLLAEGSFSVSKIAELSKLSVGEVESIRNSIRACQEFCVIEILIHSLTLSPKTMENWLRASPQFLIG